MEGNAGMKKAGIGPQARVSSAAAHEAGGELREYLQQFYLRVLPESEFEAFFRACVEKNNRKKDDARRDNNFPAVLDRRSLETQLGLRLWELNRASGAEYTARIKRELRGRFSAEDRQRIIRCFDLAGLLKVGSLLGDLEPESYDVFPLVKRACPDGLRALYAGDDAEQKTRWKKLNNRGSEVRNAWLGHDNGQIFAKMSQKEWEEGIETMQSLLNTLWVEELRAQADRLAACLARAKALKLISVEALQARTGCDETEVLAALKSARIEVENGVCCGVEEELIAKIGEYVGARQSEQRNRELQAELEKVRQELLLKDKSEASWQSVQDQLFTQKLAAVQPLEGLKEYAGGALDRRALLELAATHRFVLDGSLLRRDSERRFVEGPLTDAIRRAGRDPRQALVVEATTLYHLMRDTEQRSAIYKQMLACLGDDSRRAELEELQKRREALTPSKNAYVFVRNSLQLGPTGYPDPGRSDEEALADFLEDRCFERICVLTAGPTGLPQRLDREKTPFAVVARVSRDPAGVEAEEWSCRVFRSCLPFAAAEQDSPLLKQLRQKTDRMYRQALDAAQRANWRKKDVLGELDRLVEAQPEAAPLSRQPAEEPAVSERFPSRPALRSPGDASLELDRPVQPGDELLTEEGQRVRLGEPLTEGGETARGGEGVIYLCEQFPGLVAKIYHPGQLTAQRQEKLRTMLAHDPRIQGVCWPVHLLKNEQGQFVGYLMPRAPKGAMPLSKTVLKIGGRAVHDELMSGWTRRDLIRVAMRLAQLMERLHRKNILMGDVNAGNVMVDLTDSGSVFLVDTDSYQFDGYPCPVGTDEFTCPFVTVNGQNVARPRGQVRYGTLLRGLEEERFSLAVLLFEILLCGQNPFVNKGEKDFLTCMRERKFPYPKDTGNPDDVPDGDNLMIWKNLTFAVTTAFAAAFTEWKPCSAGQWANVLHRYLELVEGGVFTNELFPVKFHEYNREDPFFVDVRCPSALCGHREFNIGKNTYAELTAPGSAKRKDALLCRTCRRFISLHGKEPAGETARCVACGRSFVPTIRQVFYHDGNVPGPDGMYLCESCAASPVPCACCGAPMEVTVQQRWSMENNGWVPLCERCKTAKTPIARCDRCGRNFQTRRGVVIGARRNKRPLLCDRCYHRGGNFF